MPTLFEQEIIDSLVEDYDVDEEDAQDAVEAASKENFFKDHLNADPPDNAERVYSDTRWWDHLNG